jgi:hypothetical protein
MRFWIFENSLGSSLIIHSDECLSFRTRAVTYGPMICARWRGPFASAALAEDVAAAAGWDVARCSCCPDVQAAGISARSNA